MNEYEQLMKLNMELMARNFDVMLDTFAKIIDAIDKRCVLAFAQPEKTTEHLSAIADMVVQVQEMIDTLKDMEP